MIFLGPLLRVRRNDTPFWNQEEARREEWTEGEGYFSPVRPRLGHKRRSCNPTGRPGRGQGATADKMSFQTWSGEGSLTGRLGSNCPGGPCMRSFS